MHAQRSALPFRSPRAVVSSERSPCPSGWDQLWDLYYRAFEPLQQLALLNHLYSRDDFEALLGDKRITKLIARVGDEPVGLAMITNELQLVPQISPPFLHALYPEQSGRQAVFFGIMVFVDDSHRRSTVFARLIAGMGQITADSAGVVVFDICRHNMASIELDRQIAVISRWFPGSSFEQVDEQRYFAATLPNRPVRRLPVSTFASTTAQPTRPPAGIELPVARAATG